MHQNLTVILWQFNYGKSSFILLIPAVKNLMAARKFNSKFVGNGLFLTRLCNIIFARSHSSYIQFVRNFFGIYFNKWPRQ